MRRLHRWPALSLGAWFAHLGPTGAVLVFEPEIEAWGGPDPGPALPLDELTAAGPAGLLRIWPGDRFRADARNEHGRTTLYLGPASGTLPGEVRQGAHLVSWLHALHRGLLPGRTGDVLAGLPGLPHRLAMLMVGLLPPLLGWPGLRLWWRAGQARRHLRA